MVLHAWTVYILYEMIVYIYLATLCVNYQWTDFADKDGKMDDKYGQWNWNMITNSCMNSILDSL